MLTYVLPYSKYKHAIRITNDRVYQVFQWRLCNKMMYWSLKTDYRRDANSAASSGTEGC